VYFVQYASILCCPISGGGWDCIFPLLFQVAMDILPAQASAVPCEGVFSSSKETCTLRRSQISPQLMEALQVLKFAHKQDHLNFTMGRIVCLIQPALEIHCSHDSNRLAQE